MRGERPLDTIKRATGHREIVRRDGIRSQEFTCELGQLGRIAEFPYSTGAARRRELRRGDGQQRRVGVAGRQVSGTLGYVEPEQRPGRNRRPVAHPGSAPPRSFDRPTIAQQAVGRGDGVGIHPEFGRDVPDGRQSVARREGTLRNAFFDAGGYRFGPRPRYAVLYWHVNHYVLGQNLWQARRPLTLQPPRTTPTRYRERARYDRETVHRILDEALVCHLGYVNAGRPVVLPTTHARLDDTLYLHGSTGSAPMLAASTGSLPVSVTATLVDGLVLARSALHHSLVYRSVVVMGDARIVEDPVEKLRALSGLLDHIAPGRADDCRTPNARELAATAVLAVDLAEVSAKVRTGGPVDESEDHALPHWAGVLPLHLTAGTPVPADDLDPATPAPSYLTQYRRP